MSLHLAEDRKQLNSVFIFSADPELYKVVADPDKSLYSEIFGHLHWDPSQNVLYCILFINLL